MAKVIMKTRKETTLHEGVTLEMAREIVQRLNDALPKSKINKVHYYIQQDHKEIKAANRRQKTIGVHPKLDPEFDFRKIAGLAHISSIISLSEHYYQANVDWISSWFSISLMRSTI